MKLVIGISSACLLASLALAATPGAEGFRKLKKTQIEKTFPGKTFSDDTHFSFRFMADGRITGMSMGKQIHNSWSQRDDQFCMNDSKFGETCYDVWKKGSLIRLAIDDSENTLDGTLK